MKNIKFISDFWNILFVVLVIVAIFLRLYKLGEVPISLYWDEVAMLVDAKTIATTGQDMHGNSWFQTMFPSYGDYKLPVYIWLASVSVKLFGASAVSLRLINVIFSILQIFVLSLLGKQLSKSFQLNRLEQKILFISIGVISVVTPWMFHFSRVGFEGFIGQFFVTLSVLCMFIAKKKPWIWLLVTVTGVLGVYSYYSVRFVWPVLVIAMTALTHDFSSRKKMFTQLKSLGLMPLISILLWGICLVPLFSSPFFVPSQTFRLSTPSILNSDQFIIQSNQLRELAGNDLPSRLIYHRHVLRFKALLEHYAVHLNPDYLFFSGDPNLRHGSGSSGILLFATAPCLLLGIVSLWKKDRRVLTFLSVWWLIGILPAAVPLNAPHALRSLNSLAPLILLSSFGLFPIINRLITFSLNRWQWWVGWGVLVLILINSTLFFHDYFIHYPIRSASEWQPGYTELAEFIDAHRDEVRTVWANTGNDRFYLWILAFSSIEPKKIETLSFQNYQLKEIENIHFSPFNWQALESLDHKIFIVEKPNMLKISPNEKVEIKDTQGIVRFEVGLYGQ